MITKEQLQTKLNSLRRKYKTADMSDRPLIVKRIKLIRWAVEKIETPFERARKIFT